MRLAQKVVLLHPLSMAHQVGRAALAWCLLKPSVVVAVAATVPTERATSAGGPGRKARIALHYIVATGLVGVQGVVRVGEGETDAGGEGGARRAQLGTSRGGARKERKARPPPPNQMHDLLRCA